MILSSFRVLAAGVAAYALAACGGGGGTSRGSSPITPPPALQATGVVEVVHASQDAPPVNVRPGPSPIST